MTEAITNFDFSVLYWIQDSIRSDFLDSVAVILDAIFNAGFFWIMIGILLIIFRKTRTGGVMLLCAMLLALLMGELCLKNIICRPRPCHIDMTVPLAVDIPSSYSFPSGHTGSSFAAAGALFAFNKKLGIPALVIAFVVGLSRMYLFVHYLTDVLAGAVLGLLCAFAVAYIFRKFNLDNRIQRIGRKSA